ncbi:DUF21-containing protein [Fragilaria crotonensis]|nr:DUF21-containing protein [Fragilaria crotonensis]
MLAITVVGSGKLNHDLSEAPPDTRFLRVTSHLERSIQEVQDSVCAVECCQQFESEICAPSGDDWTNAIPFALQILLIAVLLAITALFSGLTLGLLSLDKTGLEIIMEGDDPLRAEQARQVFTVRENGNLLLSTLILGNVAANSFLSILMGQYLGGVIGLISSTVLIVIFGEILPQALCARYALEIGSRTVPLVKVIICLFYPCAFPLACCLNKLLGNELPTTYSNAEMHKLLQIHVLEGRFDAETADAMTGALRYKEIPAKDVMTSIENTFMLNVDEKLSFQTIATIFKTGYSRIPVYEVSRNNIIGLLFVKDLIFVDPEDDTPVRNFVQIFGRGVHVVWPDDKLGDILRELKKGKSHMALVRDVNNEDETRDPFYEIKGIITLEDIVEEILGDEIVDETDAFVDGTHSAKVDRMETFDWGRLSLLDSKILEQRLSGEEVKAVTAHLRTNYANSFVLLTDHQLQHLIAETAVEELPAALYEIGQQVPEDLIYSRGAQTDFCTVILSGKVTVIAGADQFRSDVSSWSVLGASVFQQASYKPDFTAFVNGGPCRCLRITKARFNEAVDASAVERTSNPPLLSAVPAAQETQISTDPREPGNPSASKRESRRTQLLAAFQTRSVPEVASIEVENVGDITTPGSVVDSETGSIRPHTLGLSAQASTVLPKTSGIQYIGPD